MVDDSDERHPIDRLAEEFASLRRFGIDTRVSDFVERSPQDASELERLLPVVKLLERHAPREAQSARRLGELQLDVVGDYYLVRELGRGGMGIVYEARQKSVDRRVALKILPAELKDDPRRIVRFKREADTAARLHHANIVPVYGVGRQDDTYFYTMQFIEGYGLDRVLDELRRQPSPALESDDGWGSEASLTWMSQRLRSGEYPSRRFRVRTSHDPGRFDGDPAVHDVLLHADRYREPSEYFCANVAAIGVQVAGALQHAHDAGVVHRDVKPSNLILDADGTVWVTDFGLAKVLTQPDLTETSLAVGTLRFMAPERFSGSDGPLCDIYSLGATLYELLTLQPLITAESQPDRVRQIAAAAPKPPRAIDPSIPPPLEAVVLKAIAGDPDERYGSAAEFASDLRRFLNGMPVAAGRVPKSRVPTQPPELPTPARVEARWRKSWSATAGLLLLVLVGLGWHSSRTISEARRIERTLRSELQETKTALDRSQVDAARERERAESLQRRLDGRRPASASATGRRD